MTGRTTAIPIAVSPEDAPAEADKQAGREPEKIFGFDSTIGA